FRITWLRVCWHALRRAHSRQDQHEEHRYWRVARPHRLLLDRKKKAAGFLTLAFRRRKQLSNERRLSDFNGPGAASSNVLELKLSMSRTFDVGIETLAGQVAVVPAAAVAGRHGHLGTFAVRASNLASASDAKLTNPAIASESSDGTKSFYLETFGCQMNAH